MSIKRYRANTMREALEQVKQELGENALVLDSRRVRAGSFFGLRSSEQIEVRVAADSVSSEAKRSTEAKHNRPQTAQRKSDYTSLNLTDDAPATPARSSARSEQAKTSAFAALAARAYAEDSSSESTKEVSQSTPGRNNDVPRPHPNSVEVATTAPRVVHGKNAASATTAPPMTAATLQSEVPQTQHQTLSSELERLHAELREVKFSLGTLSARSFTPGNITQETLAAFDADPELYDSPYYEAYMELTTAGLAPELARRAVRATIPVDLRKTHDSNEVALKGLISGLPSMVRFADDPLAVSPDSTDASPVIALIGSTGVGKTTTIAKLAARVSLRERRRVELITLDTYRIAAVEQLKTYAEIIGVGCHVPRSVLELDVLLRRFAGEATVLIDTIGRNPHDLADQMGWADYLRANEEIFKCLVLQATTHPADAQVAIRKFALYGANRLTITKLDETSRPGTVVSTASETTLPLVYLCAGQRVPEDIERATPEAFAARIVRANTIAARA